MHPDTYRILQDDLMVARAEGPHALREIMHYANVYRQDGRLTVQRRVNKRWKMFGCLMPAADAIASLQHKEAERG
jgi:hypothetical protein